MTIYMRLDRTWPTENVAYQSDEDDDSLVERLDGGLVEDLPDRGGAEARQLTQALRVIIARAVDRLDKVP